ncbi:MAG: hypothetical protein JSV44_05075 [Candidatus Zixiibacteriota bacterium]|nr:MAG: hypothetical protein JSV44_05075 [candidate division Zixibacteria bacterium]
MDCRKAKQRLSKADWSADRELAEHLRVCPTCARTAEAEKMLETVLQAASDETYPATPPAILRSEVLARAAAQPRKENIVRQILAQLRVRPRLFAGLGLAVIAFLFATLVPFSYTITAGYETMIHGVDEEHAITSEHLAEALSVLNYENVSVSVSRSGPEYDYHITGLPSRDAAREAGAVFSSLTGFDGIPECVPVYEMVSGSLYAQVVEKATRIEIDTEGKTDEQISNEIRARLLAQGYSRADVSVTTDPGGERRIDVQVGREAGDKETEEVLELKLRNTSDISFDVHPDDSIEKLEIDTEGKTDEQIAAEIEAKLAAQGKPGAHVTVTTGPDGKKNIEVTINKEEIR